MLKPSAQQLAKRTPSVKLLVSEARSILLRHVLTVAYDKKILGRYFLVEEVKKQGKDFLVSGTGHGLHKEVTLTASAIVALSKFRQYEIEVGDHYAKYILC